jgi:hypothetical protein
MYVSGKMLFVETIPGMGGWRIKENGGGVNSSILYSICCKKFCKCHNEPPPCTTIKKKGERKSAKKNIRCPLHGYTMINNTCFHVANFPPLGLSLLFPFRN